MKNCQTEGREHVWFTSLGMEDPWGGVVTDWCVNCGQDADPRVHLRINGKRRPVDDIEPSPRYL